MIYNYLWNLHLTISVFISLLRSLVMANFMCQIVWITGYPGIWVNILSVSVRMFLDEINIWIIRLNPIIFHSVRQASSNPLMIWTDWKLRKNSFSLLDCLWTGTSVFWFLIQTWTRTYTIGSPESPVCQLRMLNFQAPIIMQANSL